MNQRKLNEKRVRHQIKIVDPPNNDDNALDLFVAQPSNDIPRNKLVEKLCRGL